MKAKVFSNILEIGEFIIKNTVQFGMGGLAGHFIPNDNYNRIRRKVQILNDSYPDRNWQEWYDFNFNIQLENGYFIVPAGSCEIHDSKIFPDDPIRIQAPGVHSHIWEDYFVKNDNFPPEGCLIPDIKLKFELEEKLSQETTSQKILDYSYGGQYKSTNSALLQNNKRVIFTTYGTRPGCFTLVDFEKKDTENNPEFTFFNLFENFSDTVQKLSLQSNRSDKT